MTELDLQSAVGQIVRATRKRTPHGIAPFLNAAAFVQPPAATTIGQTDFAPLGGPWNQVHGPAYNDLDFSIFKRFRTTETTNLEFRAEFFNILNRTNFAVPLTPDSTDIFDSTGAATGVAGQLTSTVTTAREIQFALKFIW